MSPRDEPQFSLPHLESSSSLSSLEGEPEKLTITPTNKKSVSFDVVVVREYNRVLGDHPDVRVGPPISLGWEYTEQQAQPLEAYEENRAPLGQRRLRLSSITRANLLVNVFGVPEEDIRLAEKEVQRIQKRREQSLKQGKTGERVESALLGVKRKWRKRFNAERILRGLSAASSHMVMIPVHG